MTSNTDIINMEDILVSALELRPADQRVSARFAPSPNGYLHQGHALSAYYNHQFVQYYKRHYGLDVGQFLLRIEDIDASRSRPEYCDMIAQDMQWLGLQWDGNIIYQSDNMATYQAALDVLRDKELLYKCYCTRSDINAVLQTCNVRHGPDGPNYPETCKHMKVERNAPHCWRLDMKKALQNVPPLYWQDMQHGEQLADPSLFGDIIIWRKDAPASYHLAATCDDAKITHVIRGMDLFAYTALHRLLQYHLQLPQPLYWHHALLLGEDGEKLSKSADSLSLHNLRNQGYSALDVLNSCKENQIITGNLS